VQQDKCSVILHPVSVTSN